MMGAIICNVPGRLPSKPSTERGGHLLKVKRGIIRYLSHEVVRSPLNIIFSAIVGRLHGAGPGRRASQSLD